MIWKKFIIITKCLLLFAFVVSISSCSDKSVQESIAPLSQLETRSVNASLNKYYSIVPVMEEWKSFQTGDEMWDACQLPKGMLESLSTSDLLDACMQFPLAYDYLLVNDDRNAIRFEFENFNGLFSLIQKEDAVSALVNYYDSIQFDLESKTTDGIFRFTPFTVCYLELIIADDAVLQKATQQELKQIEKVSIKMYKEKLAYSGDLGSDNLKRTLYLWAKVKMFTGDKTPKISEFVNNYVNVTVDNITEVSQLISK